eukprot:2281183-Amphidinium_carterae.1
MNVCHLFPCKTQYFCVAHCGIKFGQIIRCLQVVSNKVALGVHSDQVFKVTSGLHATFKNNEVH